MTLKPSTFVISITPFDAAGNLDEGAFRSHLQRLAASGIGVYVGGSGSGEGYTLTGQESRRLLEIAVEELKGKVPVRAMGVEPRLAGTASGIGVCLQNLFGAFSTQAYGLLADGTVRPLIITCGISSMLMMFFGLIPWWLRQRERL